MCIFEVVSHSVDFVKLSCVYVACLLKQVPICQIVLLLFLDLVCEILSWYDFPKMWTSTSKLENHFLQVILIIALRDSLII
jgi:hypothetical protein